MSEKPEFKIYKHSVVMPRPSELDIELAGLYAKELGEPFLSIYKKNMEVLEGSK